MLGRLCLVSSLALPCLALPCLALPCLALPCLALPCLALPCLALPCLALPSPENLKHDWSSVFQLIVPQSYRENELGVAHDHELSGHLGIKKTYNNLLKHFFWPGLKSTVSQCCRSCHACQVAGKPNLVIYFSIILKANSSDE